MTPKFQVGDTVKCLNPSHPGDNPYVIAAVSRNLYYPANWFYLNNHNHGYRECCESELELVSAKEKS